MLLALQEDLELAAAFEAEADDANDAAAHLVPEVVDVALRPEVGDGTENMRLDDEEADKLLHQLGERCHQRLGRGRQARCKDEVGLRLESAAFTMPYAAHLAVLLVVTLQLGLALERLIDVNALV